MVQAGNNAGKTLRLGVWNGEGIGPEIVPPTLKAVSRVVSNNGGEVDYLPLMLGKEAYNKTGLVVPEETWQTVAELDGWILGPHDNASYPAAARAQLNPSGDLRKRADLWANIRPVRGTAGAVHPDLNIVIVRENTEGMYADRNMLVGNGDLTVSTDVSLAIGVFTTKKIRRIVRRGAQIAAARDGVLTVAHKSNVLHNTSGRYVQEAYDCAAEFGVEIRPVHIDALCAELVIRPERYRTIVAENMFGDILSDLVGALGGSLGIAGSVNVGDHQAMAQAAHGSAPDIAGQGIANPAGIMNSAAQLLDVLGYETAGQQLEMAVQNAIRETPTADLIGRVSADSAVADVNSVKSAEEQKLKNTASTEEFADHVLARL